VQTNTFQPGSDFRKALVQGRRNGWSMLEYDGSRDPALCNYVWSLSDIISFGSRMKMPETGWLLSIANRYGPPVVCSILDAPNATAVEETMEIFSRNHVFWYNSGKIADKSMIKSFRFVQISTLRR